MSYLQENEWLFLNDLIYKIHTIEDLKEMREIFLGLIQLIIPYDSATFGLASGDGKHLFSDMVYFNIPETEDVYEYDEYEQLDYTRWIYLAAKNMAFIETNLISCVERENSLFYKEFYESKGIHFAMQLCLALENDLLGIICLYRPKDSEDFSQKDLFVLNQLKEHLAHRLYIEDKKIKADNSSVLPDKYQLEKGYRLTRREIEVLFLVIKGFSNADIADSLFISEHTVKKHLKNIYKKLEVTRRTQLIGYNFK